MYSISLNGRALRFGLTLTLLALSSVIAVPTSTTYALRVRNQCAVTKNMRAFQQVNFVISPLSNSVPVRPGGETTFNVPVTNIGVFVSAHGEYSNQFQVQTRAEFGYAEWPGVKGIAYNLSLMTGALEGLKIQPTRSDCKVKSCPDVKNCPAYQGWTNPNQAAIGSPADTGCYNGATDFIVTFCP